MNSGLNIDQIERVEVLRGSRSVIYGSDAIGGGVQGVSPRRSGEDTAELPSPEKNSYGVFFLEKKKKKIVILLSVPQ